MAVAVIIEGLALLIPLLELTQLLLVVFELYFELPTHQGHFVLSSFLPQQIVDVIGRAHIWHP